jgi:hypothetical protein
MVTVQVSFVTPNSFLGKFPNAEGLYQKQL